MCIRKPVVAAVFVFLGLGIAVPGWAQELTLPADASGMGRVLRLHGSEQVELCALDQVSAWSGQWRQDDSCAASPCDDCGPVAVRNLLAWHGIDVGWSALRAETHWRGSFSLEDALRLCAPLVFDPLLYPLCTAFLDSYNWPGTAQQYLTQTLQNHVPSGYQLVRAFGDGRLATLVGPVSRGYPVIVLYHSSGDVNHYAIVTGFRWDSGKGDYVIEFANDNPRTWTDFRYRWSLDGWDDTKRAFMQYAGEERYAMWYYSRGQSMTLVPAPRLSAPCGQSIAMLNPGFVAGFVIDDLDYYSGDWCLYPELHHWGSLNAWAVPVLLLR